MASNVFNVPVDICNRALQRVGARRITALTDTTKNAKEVAFCYDKLRQAELRRNLWRFSIRRVFIRPLGTALQSWNSVDVNGDPLTYSAGALVSYTTSQSVYNNYISLQDDNTNQEPDLSPTYWQIYNGNTTMLLSFPAYVADTTYSQWQIITGSDGRLYQLVATTSLGNDPTLTTGFWIEYFGNVTASQYDNTQGYAVNELVFYPTDNSVWLSAFNGNTNDPYLAPAPTGWVLQTCTATPIIIPWPAGTGPSTEPNTKNVYYLPSGYLRVAPQEPDAGRTSVLGFPANLAATDWVFEGNYLVTIMNGAIMFRFAADVVDVTTMDTMFCEGLSCRIGFEVCEPLTQSSTKLKDLASEYKQFMGDARNVNGIEQGSVTPPLDDYIQTRF